MVNNMKQSLMYVLGSIGTIFFSILLGSMMGAIGALIGFWFIGFGLPETPNDMALSLQSHMSMFFGGAFFGATIIAINIATTAVDKMKAKT